jgi:hypothetical protein
LLAYFYFEDKGCRRSAASLLAKDEAPQPSNEFRQAVRTAAADARHNKKRAEKRGLAARESGAKPLVLFLATSLFDYLCMPSGRCKTD